MMKVDLPVPLKPGQKFVLNLTGIINLQTVVILYVSVVQEAVMNISEDGNNNYTMTQWYPRLCRYSDDHGLAKPPVHRYR